MEKENGREKRVMVTSGCTREQSVKKREFGSISIILGIGFIFFQKFVVGIGGVYQEKLIEAATCQS